MLASCAVLGAFGLLLELGLRVPVMALAQFAAPLAVGWWFTKRKCNRGYPATTFLVFAISPVASYMLLWVIVVLAFATGQSFLNVYLALTAVYVVPTVVASLLYCKLAKRFGSGEKWMFVSCLVLATFGAMQSFQSFLAGYETAEGHCRPPIGLTMCISLAQFLIPLAIGWWFMRRKHDQGQLELAS